MVIKILAVVLFWMVHLIENYLNLKVTKTAYIRALPRWKRYFAVAPVWSWVNATVHGAAVTSVAFIAPSGWGLYGALSVLAASKCLSVYRGLLVYVREHNLVFYQDYRRRNPQYAETIADRFKDFAVRITEWPL
jgi:hypothetical protein